VRLARGPDDADVIRARLRALLAEDTGRGWVPEDPSSGEADLPDEDVEVPSHPGSRHHGGGPGAPDEFLPAAGRHRAEAAAVRLDPGRPGARALWVVAGLAVLVLLALTWRDRPTAAPVEPAPTSGEVPAPDPAAASTSPGAATGPPGTVVVSVVGRVSRPGLVTLPEGARVADAVEAAGGPLPGADVTGVNLAALVADGQQVAVGVPGADPLTSSAGAPSGTGGGGAVDLNTAGAAELEGLPGVGPVLASRIVEHRERNGPFEAVEDLQDVPGIGPAILEGIADAATV
jgi:competence protein ComEA